MTKRDTPTERNTHAAALAHGQDRANRSHQAVQIYRSGSTFYVRNDAEGWPSNQHGQRPAGCHWLQTIRPEAIV
jgi:hypothetical protein